MVGSRPGRWGYSVLTCDRVADRLGSCFKRKLSSSSPSLSRRPLNSVAWKLDVALLFRLLLSVLRVCPTLQMPKPC